MGFGIQISVTYISVVKPYHTFPIACNLTCLVRITVFPIQQYFRYSCDGPYLIRTKINGQTSEVSHPKKKFLLILCIFACRFQICNQNLRDSTRNMFFFSFSFWQKFTVNFNTN